MPLGGGGKNQRRRLFECKVIKGHSILYRQPMEINVVKVTITNRPETVLN